MSHACLGIVALGRCSGASSVYFDLGEAVAALGFILTVQQLLRPIYRFRLRARYLSLTRIYSAVFAGLGLVVLAAILPSLPPAPNLPLDYPIFWEIAATIAFAIAYGAVVLAVVKPVRVKLKSIERFATASAWLLSSADERDQVDYLADLTESLPTLVRASSFGEHMFGPPTAFFDFTHRKEIVQASYAWSLLRILADPIFCGTLVSKAPWLTARMVRDLSEKHLHSRGAEQFIREIARQAILREDGMMEREVGYHGFGAAPLLSDSLFASYFIVRQYDPLDSFQFTGADGVTAGIVRRFNSAAKKALKTVIEAGDVWQCQVAFSIKEYSESLFMRAQEVRDRKDTSLAFEMHQTVNVALEMADKLQAKLTPEQLDGFYVNDPTQYRGDVLEMLAEMVYDALAFISNFFLGVDDPFWTTCIGTFQKAFPSHGQYPDGMTPFQQRLAMKLIDKLHENMDGYFPTLCRVMLACIGPYERNSEPANRTAWKILREAMYRELMRFPDLPNGAPGKIPDYLPPNISYDPIETTLTHTFTGGGTRVTKLSDLNIGPVSLATADVRRH
jgi:hypothetical protein